VTGSFGLDWAILAVSLFNTLLLLWLGLTVLLNAERRTWGVWLTGGSLLAGGAFFISHSAILGQGLNVITRGMDFWWHIGWGPAIALPFAWYIVTLWYTGFWDDAHTPLRRRHYPGFIVTLLVTFALLTMMAFANPLPSFDQFPQLNLSVAPSVYGIPVLILMYPLYLLFCLGLALDALLRPGPSARLMGDLARRRARPWLVGTSVVLLLVSLLVASVMLWIVLNGIQLNALTPIAWMDLIIAALIAVSTLLVGQAITAYEVFTGNALPRHGLAQHWRNAILLAAGYSLIIGASLTLQLRPIYILLVSTILLGLLYALFSWRSYAERERYIHHLRPFVASQRLYDHLLAQATELPEADIATPFRALCEEVLGTRLAYLAALGSLAPLVGPGWIYPEDGNERTLPNLSEIAAMFDSPRTMCCPLEPTRYGGAVWAVPLWSERGLIGLLLLGEKTDGGLYTQEEIEIARVSGERLIDTRASTEMARRLMALQRQQLAESQVLDRQARRVLHDDILPLLHTALLTLNGSADAEQASSQEAVALLTEAHHHISDLLRELPTSTASEVARRGLIGALRYTVESELGNAFDEVNWEIEPEAERRAQTIPSLTVEVLFYAAREAIRNAARYGRAMDAAAQLQLQVSILWREGLKIVIEDDGVGVDGTQALSRGAAGASPVPPNAVSGGLSPARQRSSSEDADAYHDPPLASLGGTGGTLGAGAGQGLALHSTMMAVVGGTLNLESVPGAYTRVSLTLPEGMWSG